MKLAAFLLLASCATAPAPYLPPMADVSQMVPDQAKLVDVSHMDQHPDIPVWKDQYEGLPSGVLVSERKYATIIQEESDRKRLAAELATSQSLRLAERGVFVDYEQKANQRIQSLERANAWRPWLLVGGFIAGALGALAVSR